MEPETNNLFPEIYIAIKKIKEHGYNPTEWLCHQDPREWNLFDVANILVNARKYRLFSIMPLFKTRIDLDPMNTPPGDRRYKGVNLLGISRNIILGFMILEDQNSLDDYCKSMVHDFVNVEIRFDIWCDALKDSIEYGVSINIIEHFLRRWIDSVTNKTPNRFGRNGSNIWNKTIKDFIKMACRCRTYDVINKFIDYYINDSVNQPPSLFTKTGIMYNGKECLEYNPRQINPLVQAEELEIILLGNNLVSTVDKDIIIRKIIDYYDGVFRQQMDKLGAELENDEDFKNWKQSQQDQSKSDSSSQ